jgi:hypothetical protein
MSSKYVVELEEEIDLLLELLSEIKDSMLKIAMAIDEVVEVIDEGEE